MNVPRSAAIEKARWFGYDVTTAGHEGQVTEFRWFPTIRQARAFVHGHFLAES